MHFLFGWRFFLLFTQACFPCSIFQCMFKDQYVYNIQKLNINFEMSAYSPAGIQYYDA